MPNTLEDMLVDRKLLSRDQLRDAAKRARAGGKSLTATLVEEQVIAERDLLDAAAAHQGIPLVELKEMALDERAVRRVSAKLVSHYFVAPLKLENGVLTLAVCDPMDMAAIEDIETDLGVRVERVLATREDIAAVIRRHYGVGADTVERIVEGLDRAEDTHVEDGSHDLGRMAQDVSVVRLVNQLLDQAIKERTTDVHLEVYRGEVVARRRIDGVLYDTPVPRDINVLYPAIVSRIKLMAGLNIVERRMPQDGRTRVKVDDAQYDLRISVVPSIHGENLVIRILPTQMLFGLDRLGLSAAARKQMESLMSLPHGIVFVTGPTGSGKSTTLYACLRKLNTRERKIITIEDPVEYELRGAVQTQINPKIGLTFAHALRSMLRHDPDVMMVGEVRDVETAAIAVQTALTGHLVLSTLHTNDAAGGAIRLLDMGLDPYLIASTVRAFVAQRLVRVVCSACKEGYEQDGKTLYRGRGCPQCAKTGYRGRTGIYECLVVGEEARALILARSSAAALREKATALGMRTLAEDGWDKVSAGITTADEVLRVTRMGQG